MRVSNKWKFLIGMSGLLIYLSGIYIGAFKKVFDLAVFNMIIGLVNIKIAGWLDE